MAKIHKIFKIVFRTLLLTLVGVLLVYNVYILIARTVFGNGMPVTLPAPPSFRAVWRMRSK